MKLKPTFIRQTIDDTVFLVPTEGNGSVSLIKGNSITGRIIDLLQTETTQEAIVDALYAEYEAPRERIAADVAQVIETLRGAGAIEE